MSDPSRRASPAATRPTPPSPSASSSPPGAERRWPLLLLRYVLPAGVVIAGIVVMGFGGETNIEGGGGIVSAGLAIFLVNLLFRAGANGDDEREAEDRAREFFDRHGRWPS